MERIRSIQQLRMQKELLQLQQMIVELRMRKEVNDIKGRFQLKPKLLPVKLLRSGLKNDLMRGVVTSVAGKLRKLLTK